MDIKLLEIRDRSTLIPGLAIRFASRNEKEVYLLLYAGYSPQQAMGVGDSLVMLTYLVGEKLATCDPHAWGDRTMKTVHNELVANWDSHLSGDVIDVRYILGETSEPCQTDLGR